MFGLFQAHLINEPCGFDVFWIFDHSVDLNPKIVTVKATYDLLFLMLFHQHSIYNCRGIVRVDMLLIKTYKVLFCSKCITPFLNKRKMPTIRSILADDKLVSGFKTESELFNSHFAAPCTPVKKEVHYQSLNIYNR